MDESKSPVEGNYESQWQEPVHWLSGRMFANGPGEQGSIPGNVMPKTFKMVLDTTLLNAQHYKVRFKGKVKQTREMSSTLPYTSV